jgi:preprotein translocase subunit SecY
MTSQEQSYGNSFIWTLFLVAIFIGLQYVPLPFVDSVFENVNKTNGISRFNIVALGLMPVVSAFSITEFFSFLVSPLSAWRMAGICR